ncbi:uncharacterized protein Tco025E_02770 [Trypanosoma conorhini]|uniref:Uncharacterized protein n=1 Tax=Trypanosoma conorhini TaxID=83891 RepID=A0A422Q1K6_9TRYP|nr:uncharacterized protein Tco025E_02770 [Trypanosoma conorhini]RNF23797.1 hypothetical protein Tco025E_02770 [Trypanosoma conorhini]
MHQMILEVCKPLAEDIAELLTTGACALSRGGPVGPRELQQMALTSRNASHYSAAGFFSAGPHLPRLREMKLTFQWTVWHNDMVAGTPLREYPRALQVLLSGMLRVLTPGLPTKGERVKGTCAVASTNPHHDNFRRVSEGSGVVPLNQHLPCALMELWMPLPDLSWMCVSRRHHHVGGVVFYGSASLKSCFEAASELFEYMPCLL